MLFKWKDTYSVGVLEIDNQHKKLFEIGGRIYDLATLNDSYDHYDEIMQIINELKDYTIYHFSYEEKLMKEKRYADIDNHSIEHMFFVKKLQRIERKDIDTDQGNSLMELISFTADWITSHILSTDTKYKPLFVEKVEG